MLTCRRRRAAGFTLLEVVIALAILAVSLTVLLESQASSLANASRARDLTIATLLARAKMIDIEQQLFDEGFVVGDVEEQGDFKEEGQEAVKWRYKVSEVEMDLSSLSSLCGGYGDAEQTEEGGAADCESLFMGVGGGLTGFTEDIAQSVRVVDLTVTWPAGRYEESMSVRALVSREDFALGAAPADMGLGEQPPGGAAGPETAPPGSLGRGLERIQRR